MQTEVTQRLLAKLLLAAVALVQELSQQVQAMVLPKTVDPVVALVAHGHLEEMGQEPQGRVMQVAMVFLVTAVVAVAVQVLLVQVLAHLLVLLAQAEQV